MALVVKLNLDPSPMPQAGGKTTIGFVARATPKHSFLKARFEIRPTFPYEHTQPTDSASPKSKWGKRRRVEVSPQTFKTQMELVCVGECSELLFVRLNVRIHEVDAKGRRLRDNAGKLRRPITRTVSVRLT